MVVSQAEIDRLRTEADTIFTRIETVRDALVDARSREGDHWDDRELQLTLETPTGEPIDVVLDLDATPAENAQRRYERAGDLEATLAERTAIAGELAQLPADPRAVLLLCHIDEDGPAGSRSIAGDLDADHAAIADLCERLLTSGMLELDDRDDGPSTYRLTDESRAILDVLDTEDGKRKFLEWVDDARTLAARISRGGPDYPQMTAAELDMDLAHVRHCYRSMERIGLVTTYDGSIIKGTERKLKPKSETHRKHTYYMTTSVADRLLRDLE